MKKMAMLMAIILVAVMITSNAVAATSTMPYFDVIDGQKVMFGNIQNIVDYLSGLNRQQLLDLAIIKNDGEYYARILPWQQICTWSDGTQISAYELSANMQEYKVLRNAMFLIEDEAGCVTRRRDRVKLAFVDDAGYPEQVYSAKDEALVEKFILAEAYPNADASGTLSEKNGFEKQELFKALVLGSFYSDRYQEVVYFMAWKVINETTIDTCGGNNQKERLRQHQHHNDHKDKPNPDPSHKPENNPRPSEGTPENNSRPEEHVPSGSGEVSNDPDPFNGGGSNTGSGQVSNDPDPMSGGSSNTGSGSVSHDPDPMNGGSSNTGSGSVSHDVDPMSGGSGSSGSGSDSGHGSGSVSHDVDPMSGGSSSSSSSTSEHSSSSNSGTGSVSHDSDPMSSSRSSESSYHESSSRSSESSYHESSSRSSESSYHESNSRPSESSHHDSSESSHHDSSESSHHDSSESSHHESSESYGSGSVSSDFDPF